MDQTFTFVLLLLSSSGTYGKYVYNTDRVTREQAQARCQKAYTELAPISNTFDIGRLQQLGIDEGILTWIGLERNPTNKEEWLWSGGGNVSTLFWEPTQPNRIEEIYGAMRNYKWHDSGVKDNFPFLCYNVIVVREAKTWEEALEYCRLHHCDLASVASETEQLLIQRELKKYDNATQVWTGLHFFPGGWLWMDGQPLEYEAWGQGGRQECPRVSMGCATFRVNGGTDEKKSVWESHDCEERLPFICY